MRLPQSIRSWLPVAAAPLAVLLAVGGIVLVRAQSHHSPTTTLADPGSAVSGTAEPSGTAVSTPLYSDPDATAAPEPSIVPGGPVPQRIPGTASTRFMFVNNDPEYDAVFFIGDTRYGPFRPWTRTKFYTHTTQAGMVFRLEFPDRPKCNDRNRALDAPLHGSWALLAERIYKSRGCASLGVSGADPISAVPGSEPWTPDPVTPSPEPTPDPEPTTPSTGPSTGPETTPAPSPSS